MSIRTTEIRSLFIDFFVRNGHKEKRSSPLVPQNDPTLLFTNSGMVQFKGWFLGTEEPDAPAIVTAQKCVRAGGKHNDLDNVGYTARHHTFFEMLGNFSFGEYFKARAIELAWKFMGELGIDKDRLLFTVYIDDDEAFNLWKKITNCNEKKIIKIPTHDNFWSMGDTGPCGPCTEIFYDHGPAVVGGLPGSSDAEGDRFIEIWNLVFMQYEMFADGTKTKLARPCVDTGMGIERVAAIMQGVHDNYDIDLFKHLIKKSKELSNNSGDEKAHRVIADHLRSTSFLIADGILPSNEGRGYVLRRIMRRAMRHIHMLGIKKPMMYKLVEVLVEEMGQAYPELTQAQKLIESVVEMEEERFGSTVDSGLKVLKESIEIARSETRDILTGSEAFKLYDTYGFPLDLTLTIAQDYGFKVDEEGFLSEMENQKERARAAWVGSGEKALGQVWFELEEELGTSEFVGYSVASVEAIVLAIVDLEGKRLDNVENQDVWLILNQTPFYAESGGQVGDIGTIGDFKVLDTQKKGAIIAHKTKILGHLRVGENLYATIDIVRRTKIRANHSATHLLQYALRKILGEQVVQKGSLVEDSRLRFDFTHNGPLTDKQIAEAEKLIQEMIVLNYPIATEEMLHHDAINAGAVALFGDKYEEQVRVVSMGDSMELCGGTHAERTGNIGLFKIIAEESIASGVRRIIAMTGTNALEYVIKQEQIMKNIAENLKCAPADLEKRVDELQKKISYLNKELENLKISSLLDKEIKLEQINGIDFVVKHFVSVDAKLLREAGDKIHSKYPSAILFIAASFDDKVSLLVKVPKILTDRVSANDLLQHLVPFIDAKGGGNKEYAQAGGHNLAGIEGCLVAVRDVLKDKF